MQGENLLGAPDEERVVYAEEDHEGNELQAIRSGGLKLIRANRGNPRGLDELELFDVTDDPGEHRNVLDHRVKLAEKLLDELLALELRASASAAAEQMAEISKEECEQLRALGYVEDCP